MTPAILLLKQAKVPHRLHSYTHDSKTPSYGLEAADKLQLPPAQVFKTLLAQTDTAELIVAIVPVSGTLDLKALAQAAHCKKCDMADPAQAQRSTGYLLGGISPLGQKKALRTFLDGLSQCLRAHLCQRGPPRPGGGIVATGFVHAMRCSICPNCPRLRRFAPGSPPCRTSATPKPRAAAHAPSRAWAVPRLL